MAALQATLGLVYDYYGGSSRDLAASIVCSPCYSLQVRVLTPTSFLVIFPAIAQRLVDDADLPIYAASIMSPTPDSVVYSLNSSLKIPAGVTVNLKPVTLSLFTKATGPKVPYIQVTLPEYHLKGNTSVSIVNQTATILDQTQFRSFLADAVKSKVFTMSAAGSTVAYLGALKAGIKLNKNIDLTGELEYLV